MFKGTGRSRPTDLFLFVCLFCCFNSDSLDLLLAAFSSQNVASMFYTLLCASCNISNTRHNVSSPIKHQEES